MDKYYMLLGYLLMYSILCIDWGVSVSDMEVNNNMVGEVSPTGEIDWTATINLEDAAGNMPCIYITSTRYILLSCIYHRECS